MDLDLINSDRASFILSTFSTVIVVTAVIYFLYKYVYVSMNKSQ